jgi:hypothetical protein
MTEQQKNKLLKKALKQTETRIKKSNEVINFLNTSKNLASRKELITK